LDRNLSIVHSPGKKDYRKAAQENWGLTDEQMKGMHVHHFPPVSLGGRNIPEHLYVCSPSLHSRGWHSGEEFILWAAKGGSLGGVKAAGRGGRRNVREGFGFWKQTKEEWKETQSKGGKIQGEANARSGHLNRIRTPESTRKGARMQPTEGKAKGGRKSGKEQFENGTGMFGQRWKNTDPNHEPYVSAPAGLTHWQKKRGIDTSLRVRVS
jgi:hypothetical protein